MDVGGEEYSSVVVGSSNEDTLDVIIEVQLMIFDVKDGDISIGKNIDTDPLFFEMVEATNL